MSSNLSKINELTAKLPEAERIEVESKLMEAAETLIATYQADAAWRNDITRRSLEDIAARNVIDIKTFDAEMDRFMSELDAKASA